MAYSLSPWLKPRFFITGTNRPLAGGLMYTYKAGTTDPATTYSNDTGTTNTNPIVLDSDGQCDLFLDDAVSYRIILKNSAGVTQFDKDRIASLGSTQVQSFNSIAALRLRSGTTIANAAKTLGYYAAGDGGGNSFYWDSTSTATDNAGTVIKPTAVSGAGRWLATENRELNVLQFGATADGATNDTVAVNAAIQASFANNSGTVFFPAVAGGYAMNRVVSGSQRGIPVPANITLKGNNTKLTLLQNAEHFLLGRSQDYGDTTYVSFYGITAGVDYAQITADCAIDAVTFTVTAGNEAAFSVGTLVYVRLGQATYDSAEPEHFYYAKVVSTASGSVTLDRPSGYAMSVAATTNTRQRRIIKVDTVSQNIVIDGFYFNNPASGSSNSEFGIHCRYASNVTIRNCGGINVGPGLVGGQFMENFTIDNVYLDGCSLQGQASKGRMFTFGEAKSVSVNNYRCVNFAGNFAFIEGGSEDISFTNGVIVNNFVGRAASGQALFFMAGGKDLRVNGLKVEGNPTTIVQTSTDTKLTPPFLFNVEISPTVAPLWASIQRYFDVDHVGENVKLGNVFHFTRKRRFTLEVSLLASQAYKQHQIPNGVITKMTLTVTNKTGLLTALFAKSSGANPIPSAGGGVIPPLLTNNVPYVFPKTDAYPWWLVGSGHPWSDPANQRFFAYSSDGTVVAGSKAYVEIEYFPAATPTILADVMTWQAV